MAGAVLAGPGDFLAEGPAPSRLVGVGTCLGCYFTGRSLRLCRGRGGLLRAHPGRHLFAIFPAPAAKKTHGVMVDRRLADSPDLRPDRPAKDARGDMHEHVVDLVIGDAVGS